MRTVLERVDISTRAARLQSRMTVKKNMKLKSYLIWGMLVSIEEMVTGNWSLSSTYPTSPWTYSGAQDEDRHNPTPPKGERVYLSAK